MLSDWLNIITNIPNEKIRETLYNIEVFRADTLLFAVAAKPKS